MSSRRISIDVTEDEHRLLKAMAAVQGMSMKDLVLRSTLGSDSANMAELERLLLARVAEAEKSPIADSVADVFDRARVEHRSRSA